MTAQDETQAWQDWVGRARSLDDTIDPGRARALQATLDDAGAALKAGDALPPLWHWLYFWSTTPGSALGPDGHAARGGFLPPIDLPRRMWAGSRVGFHRPLPLGAAATCRSRISDIRFKEGRSGRLAFVTLRHEVTAHGDLCIADEQDIVYHEAAKPDGKAEPGEDAPGDATWTRQIDPDPVLLFRYSALTFNGHRIHYDRPYATGVEGYPGLIVHGPLLATLMIELARTHRPKTRIAKFQFRALSPIFDTAPFTVAGKLDDDGQGADLWVANPQGKLAMRGRIGFA
jgi:3-methylfumaryl-CoA hydratase